MQHQTCNLFVYGSLRDPSIFKSVCGLGFTLRPSHTDPHILFAELALLAGYRKVSPDNVYFYAVKAPRAKLEGFIIYDIPPSAMKEIDKYEGKFYDRESIIVNTANGSAEAQAYMASAKSMKKHFGDRFRVNLIHELWLRKRIEKFFQKHTRPGERSLDADIERRAKRELLATTERDLVLSHLGTDSISDFYLEHELDRPCPSIKHLFNELDAKQFLPSYLAIVVKQVILNQFEEHIRHRYRYEIDRLQQSPRYFNRGISMLIALRMINVNIPAVDMVLDKCIETMPPGTDYDLIDYVKYGITAADSIFDSRVARSEIERIRVNRQPGLIPIGAELELSNLGFQAVKNPDIRDHVFDSFKYFDDFRLNVLTWKLGGYVDDHSDSNKYRKQGFLELAPGRLNIAGELSKPATADPWIMNQLIREIASFYPVRSHSLHLSFQLRKNQVKRQNILPLSFVKCLLVLGGGIQRKTTGRLWISRMAHDEIQQYTIGEELVFARTSKRQASLIKDELEGTQRKPVTTYTQQYKFIRLDPRANYEPLILAFKGLQMSYNPGDYITAGQLSLSKRLQRQYAELKEWSQNPNEISRRTKGRFLDAIRDGLMKEAHDQPAHKLHYIEWALAALDLQIRLFNKQIQAQNVTPAI